MAFVEQTEKAAANIAINMVTLLSCVYLWLATTGRLTGRHLSLTQLAIKLIKAAYFNDGSEAEFIHLL